MSPLGDAHYDPILAPRVLFPGCPEGHPRAMVVARGTCLCFSGRACVGSRHLCSISTLVLITTLSVGKDAGGEREKM